MKRETGPIVFFLFIIIIIIKPVQDIGWLPTIQVPSTYWYITDACGYKNTRRMRFMWVKLTRIHWDSASGEVCGAHPDAHQPHASL